MRVSLEVVRTEPNGLRPDRPDLYFYGTMTDFAASIMRGRVWMDEEGTVKWMFVC